MLHYAPQHVSSSTLLIIRRINCITTDSGIVTLCKQPYSMRVESGLQSVFRRICVCVCVCVCVSLCLFAPLSPGYFPTDTAWTSTVPLKRGTPGGRAEAGSRPDAWRSGPVEQERVGNGPSLFQQRQALVGYAGKVLKRIRSMDWRYIVYPRRGVNWITKPSCTANKM